jgi:hypothetical protein
VTQNLVGTNEHLRLPPHAPGLRIGLFGGSFNPAHDGHRLASLTALRRLQLDRVWWLVTPGNPLKDNSGLPSLAERVRFSRTIADHSRIHVTGIEASLRTRYTADTLRALKRRCRSRSSIAPARRIARSLPLLPTGCRAGAFRKARAPRWPMPSRPPGSFCTAADPSYLRLCCANERNKIEFWRHPG